MGGAARIRAARAADAGALAALLSSLGYPVDEATLAARLAAMGPADAVRIAERDGAGEAIGVVQASLRTTLSSGTFVEIAALVVDPSARRMGLGRLLVEEAARWAAERGAPALRVRCQEKRAEAHAFYRALGFSEVKAQRVFSRPVARHGGR